MEVRLYEALGRGSQIGGSYDPHSVTQHSLLMITQRTQQMALGQHYNPYLRSRTHD